jgi:SAM-dependent methyltransferase
MGRNGIGRGTTGSAVAVGTPEPPRTASTTAVGGSESADGSGARAPGADHGPSGCAGGATERGYAVTRARSGVMEGYGPSSYGDGMADVYDEWYADRGDIDGAVTALAALASATGPAPVLELGIGSGRLARPLAASGMEVWGIDASAAMVARLRAKPGGDQLPVAVGDMADLDLSSVFGSDQARFSLVFAADNTFFNLTTAEAQARCLSRVRAVLAPHGRVVIEAFVPAADAPASSVDARTVAIDHVVLTVTNHDPVAQTVAGQHIELRASGVRLHPWSIRYAPPDELDALASAAGLSLVERWSDWRRTPFTADDNVHVSVYGMTR